MPNPRQKAVLLINQYFPPDTSATASVFWDLAQVLQENGYQVTMLCGRPSYNPTYRLPWRLLSTDLREGIRIQRVGSTALSRATKRGRVFNYLSFLFLGALTGLFRPRPDAVICGSDPPLAVWTALLVARGRPVIYYIQDIHPDTALVSGMMVRGIRSRVWDAAHSVALRLCTKVVCLGAAMQQALMSKSVPQGQLSIVISGAEPPQTLPDRDLVEKLRDGADFMVVHAGNIGEAFPLEVLVEASKALAEECRFLFVGSGKRASALVGTPTRLTNFRQPGELPSVMAAGDLQLVGLRRGMEGLVVPSKLYNVLAHGRPILAIVPEGSEVAEVVTQFECGLVADPEDAEDVVAKIRTAHQNPDLLQRMSECALVASRSFRRREHFQRFVDIVEAAT